MCRLVLELRSSNHGEKAIPLIRKNHLQMLNMITQQYRYTYDVNTYVAANVYDGLG